MCREIEPVGWCAPHCSGRHWCWWILDHENCCHCLRLHEAHRNHSSAGIFNLLRTLCNAWRLPVCLLAAFRETYWTDLHENFTTDVSEHKEELINSWKPSASGSGSRNFLKDSLTLRDRRFFHSYQTFMKISSQTYPWTRKSPLNFGSNPDPESVSVYRLRSQTTFSLANVCSLLTALVCCCSVQTHPH